jgi:hypothetical protein
MSDGKRSEMSRREALTGACKVAAGAAVLSLGGSGLVATAAAKKSAAFPWGYKKIDPQVAGEIAYEAWYEHYCCYAAVNGILKPLQEKLGEPYASLPLLAFKWAHGGGMGWGTLCGSLNGAGISTGFIAGDDGEKIINDVIAWYTETELPIYRPKRPRSLVRTVNASASPLCHISAGKWMKKEGVAFASPQRQDRCARVSADVAMKTVSLLNEWADGKYKPTHGDHTKEYGITTQENCMECHGDDVPSPKT